MFSHWSANWPALVCYAVVAIAHLTGLRRVLATGGAPSPGGQRELRKQAGVFQGGLLLALLAFVSPVGYLSDTYIWVRALQFLLVALVAPGVMVLGAPWQALRASVRPTRSVQRPGGTRADGLVPHPDRPVPGMESIQGGRPWLLARPGIAVVAVNVVWLGWQLPALFDAALTSSVVALVSHVMCLGAGIVFWLQVVGSRPFSPAATPLRRMRLVVGTVGAMTILGMVLVFGSGVIYPVYANSAHHVMTVLDDQQLSGAVLWMGSLLPLITVAVTLLMRWMSDEESAELSAGLDRLLTPRKNAWATRSGSR